MSSAYSCARSTGPRVHTVSSACWFALIERLRSIASSRSTRVSSVRWRSIRASLRSAYSRIGSVISRFLPLT